MGPVPVYPERVRGAVEEGPRRGREVRSGPARLDKILTEARTAWLDEGSRVPQQQINRDFGKSRAEALKDIKARLPKRQTTKLHKKVARQREETGRK